MKYFHILPDSVRDGCNIVAFFVFSIKSKQIILLGYNVYFYVLSMLLISA